MSSQTASSLHGLTASPGLFLDVKHVITGTIEHGDARGRTLGFPTANLAVPSSAPGLLDGVYAGWLELHGYGLHLAAISIGHRPTYYGREGVRLLEAHVIDFSADLYDLPATAHLGRRLRPQRRFSGTQELVTQLERDVQSTREWAVSMSTDLRR